MKGLDKWLETNPNDQYDSYFEAVVEAYTNEFYTAQEDDFVNSDKETDIINKCIQKNYTPQKASIIIQRLHSLFKI
jgi:hypothetical protein